MEEKKCRCGSGLYPETVHDGYGIYLISACEKCAPVMERYDTEEPIYDENILSLRAAVRKLADLQFKYYWENGADAVWRVLYHAKLYIDAQLEQELWYDSGRLR